MREAVKETIGAIALILFLFLLFFFAGVAEGGEQTGSHLLNKCRQVIALTEDREADLNDAAYCMGFVRAVYQGVSMTAYYCESKRYCAPDDGITTEQGVRIVVKYLQENPVKLHQDEFDLAFAAFINAFPCKE